MLSAIDNSGPMVGADFQSVGAADFSGDATEATFQTPPVEQVWDLRAILAGGDHVTSRQEIWRTITTLHGQPGAAVPRGAGGIGGAGDGSGGQSKAGTLRQAQKWLVQATELLTDRYNEELLISEGFVVSEKEHSYTFTGYSIRGMLLAIPTALEVSEAERAQAEWQNIFRTTGRLLVLLGLKMIQEELEVEKVFDLVFPQARKHFEQLGDAVALGIVEGLERLLNVSAKGPPPDGDDWL